MSEKSDVSFVLVTKDGETRTIAINEETSLLLGEGQNSSLTDLQLNTIVAVIGNQDDQGNFVARKVIGPKLLSALRHSIRGFMTEVNATDGTLKLQTRDGEIWTIRTTSETHYLLRGIEKPSLKDFKPDMVIAVFGSRDGVEERTVEAKAIVLIPPFLLRRAARWGEVTDVADHSFTLLTMRGDALVRYDVTTQFRIRSGEQVGPEVIKKGAHLLVLGVHQDDGSILAKIIGVPKSTLAPAPAPAPEW